MSDAPAVAALGELAVSKGLIGGPFGSSLGKKDYVPSGIPVIRGQNLGGPGRFSSDEFVYVTEEKVLRELNRNLAEPGDVIFTQRGTLGQVGVVPPRPFDKYVISQSQMRLRVDRNRATPEYVYYCFRDPAMLQLIESRAIVTGVPHINLGILSDLPVPYRSLHEQRAIVEVLGTLDDKIDVNIRVARLAHEVLQALWRRVVNQATKEVPFESVADIDKGLSYKGEFLGEGEPLVNLGNFGVDGRFHGDALKYYSGPARERHWVRCGDLVIANTDLTQRREILGQPALVEISADRALFSHHVYAVRLRDGRDDSVLLWLYSALRERAFRDRAMTFATGTTVAALPRDAVLTYEVPWPDSDARLDWSAAARSLVDTAAAAVAENRALASVRDTLLPPLLSGELRARDVEALVGETV